MEEEVKYCKNCKRDISAKNYVIHTVHCERNIQLCKQCGEPVPRSDQEKHEEEFHSKDNCSECGISVEKWQIERHKETCIKKLVPCEYCELEVPLDNLPEHTVACGSRTEQCLKCKKHVMLKDLQEHPRYCSRKEPEPEALPCEHCDRQVDWNEFMEHTAMCGTRTERCYLCGDHVMVRDRETHLVSCEKEICAKKLVACEYCEAKVPLDDLSEHISVCGSRKVQCPKCYERIMLKDVEKHPRYCSRKEPETVPCDYCGDQIDRYDIVEHTTTCGTRTERCLLCDEHVMVKDRDTHFETCAKALNFSEKICCDHCGGSFDNSSIERHVEICRSRLVKCYKCNNYIQKKEMGLHLVMCEQTKQFRPEFPCKYCGESYLGDFLEDHADKCGTRTQKCKKCDIDIELKNMETHSKVCKEAPNFSEDISCDYCGVSFSNRSIQRHVELCRSRTVKCDKCNSYILMKDRELHHTMCEQTKQFRPEFPCKYCGESYLGDLMEDHADKCGTRTQKCKKCDIDIALKDMETHSKVCRENRGLKVKYSSPCKYCGKSFPSSLLEDHTKICISRYQKCEKCGKYFSLKDIEMHLNTCKEMRQLRSKLPCKYCGDLYPSDFLEDHAEICESQPHKCQKCNRYIALKSMETHSNECKESTSKNFGECPVCHESIPWIEMNVHKAACSLMSSDTNEYERQNQFNERTLREESGALTNKISDENKTQLQKAQKRCPFCLENFPFHFLVPHLKVCQERPYNCDTCSKAMPYREKEEHKNRCLDRQKLAEDFLLHDEETSNNKELKKLKKCQFCDSRFPDVVLQDHLKHCENREEKCTLCLENVPVKDMHDHRLRKCNFGIRAENKNFNNRTNTYAEAFPDPPKNFERRGYLEDNVEICPSCMCKIPEERYRQHLSLCYNGETLCHFCYVRILKRTEHSHFQNCPVVRQFVEEDKNSESKKKKGNTNKGKSVLSTFTSWLSPNKGKSFERNNSQQASQEFYSYPSNRGLTYERDNITSVHPPVTGLNEVNELPCEFCGQMWPSEFLIEHESGCRPDLVSFPKTNDGNEDNQKFATAAATVSHISHTPVLSVSPRNIGEEDNDWKVQSRRKNQGSIKDSMDYRKMERNGAQKQLNAKDRFFYYPSQDPDEVSKNQPGSLNKKRYPQARESQETSKTKPDKDIRAKKDDSKKDEFTSFRFSTSRFDKESQNTSISRKKNDEEYSTDVKNYDETKKSSSYSLQELSDESSPIADYPKSNFNSKMKAVGAERTEKRRNLHSKNDGDVNKETSLQKSNTFDESNKSEPYNFLETTESRTFNPSIPAIWNTEGSFSSDKALRSHLLKPFDLSEAKDKALSNAAENIEHRAFDTNMLDMDYDARNNETFGSSFVESINNGQKEERALDSNIQETDYDVTNNETFGNYIVESINNNQKEENDNDTKSERSNSDDTFYDADDGGAKYFESINDNYHGSSNTQKEKLSHYDFDDLNCSSRNQKENVNPSDHEDSIADSRLEEEDLNLKDSDLDGYFQFLHYKSKKQPDCKCGNKKCCCELSSVAPKTSLQTCSFKDATCSKSHSEPMDLEAFVVETKTSSQMKYKRNIEFSSKERVKDDSTDFDEAMKWRKYRVAEKKVVFSSDSE